MFEQPPAAHLLGAIIPVSAQGMVIVVLAMLATVLLLLVIGMRRKLSLRVGKFMLESQAAHPPVPGTEPTQPMRRRRHSMRARMPSPPDLNGDSRVHSLAELAAASEQGPEPTQPFDLSAVAAAVSSSETLRALEALRAVEARRNPGSESFPTVAVRTFKMPVCPLFVLYEVTGSSPRVHVVPSDMRSVEVGRSAECTVFSPNPSVSQHHFRIVITPGGSAGNKPSYTVELEDCGSRNGTWVNHKRVQSGERTKMRDGDIIEAASSRYLFYYVMRSE